MSTQIPVKTSHLIYTLNKTIELGREAIKELQEKPTPTRYEKEKIEDAIKETEEGLVKVGRFIRLLEDAAKLPAFHVIKVEMDDFEKFGLLEYDLPAD